MAHFVQKDQSMNNSSNNHKATIGRAELVHFDDFEINDIPAKTDTGAYRSAIHASDIKPSDDGKTLSFKILGNHPVFGSLARDVTVDNFRMVNISNSFGHNEDRYEVDLQVNVSGQSFKTSFSLANRERKVFPILLGRKLLNKRFLVDTDKTGVDRSALKKLYEINIPDDEEQQYENSHSVQRARQLLDQAS